MKVKAILKSTSLFLGLLGFLSISMIHAQSDPSWDDREQIMLLDFEKRKLPKDTESYASKVELVSNEGVTSGNQALKINFKGDVKASGFNLSPKKPIDASGFKNFALVFDVTNVSDMSVHLFVSVHNEKGHNLRRSAAIGAGKTGTMFYELAGQYVGVETGLRDDPTPWDSKSIHMKIHGLKYDIDYSQISSIRFYMSHAITDKSIILDNVRLVETPPHSPDYLVGIVDKFGQYTREEFGGKIKSDEQLKKLADKELRELAVSKPMADRGLYGGWKDGPQLEATGFFRTEKVDGVWGLVDPQGYLFFSNGIANVRMANTTSFTGRDFRNDTVRYRDPEDVTPEDSRGMIYLPPEVTNTSYIAYPDRYKMFNWLPEYGSPLANHLSYRRSQHIGPFAHGETFSFYQANLERRYGEKYPGSYLMKWRDITLDRFLDWGFTSFGNWADPDFYHAKRMPYFANGWIIGDYQTVRSGMDYWGPMPDVFDPEFTRRAKVTVKVVAEEVLGTPWCIGVFIDNEKSWGAPGTPKGQYGIVWYGLVKKASDSYLKTEFMRLLKEKYDDIAGLNTVWEKNFASWEELENGVDFKNAQTYSTGLIEDASMLLEAYATKYFQVVHDAMAEEMPNHLYLGCRFASWGMGPEVRKAAKKYVDVMSYNVYHESIGVKDWDFLKELDKPSIIGEFHIGTQDAGLFHPGLVHGSDQADRAQMYKRYVEAVLDNPYFVGAHWFQYIDSPLTGRAHDGENYNVGFVTNQDVPYPDMVKAAKEVNSNLYKRKFGKK